MFTRDQVHDWSGTRLYRATTGFLTQEKLLIRILQLALNSRDMAAQGHAAQNKKGGDTRKHDAFEHNAMKRNQTQACSYMICAWQQYKYAFAHYLQSGRC